MSRRAKVSDSRVDDLKAIRQILRDQMAASGKTRPEIAEQMTALLKQTVTDRMLNTFAAQSKELHRWPAEFDLAFCEVVGSPSLLQERARRAGLRLIGPREEQLIKLGRAYAAQVSAMKKLAEVML